MIVIKLGGSLLASGLLVECLKRIEQGYNESKVIIVPGGGILADQVRRLQQEWRFDDRAAHEMAILAMQQMALLIKGLLPGAELRAEPWNLSRITCPVLIWSPNLPDLDRDNLPATWELTSDSLAAWLAIKLQASELILVKSAVIDKLLSWEKLAEENIVDSLFCSFARQARFSINVLNVGDFICGVGVDGNE